jgi:ABC-type antimicrobial peptide transport system permease subunit
VVPTGKYFSLGEDPTPYFYRYTGRDYIGAMTLHIRTAGDPRAHFADVQGLIRTMDPDLPVTDLTTMIEQMDFALLPARLIAWSVAIFAVLALLLASVGLYGLIAYSVTQRTREIGVRIAVGAQPGQVVMTVVGSALLLLGIGAAVGLALGVGSATAMSSFLYGLSPVDPVAIGSALAVLAAVTWLASWIPARRAVRIDPMKALNAE